MGKRIQIAFAVLFVALLGVFARQVWRTREPVYQGKPLSAWLKGFYTNGVVRLGGGEKADEAVRQAGTNALPTLLRMLEAKDSPLKLNLIALAQKQHIFNIEYTPAADWNILAARGFGLLGPEAQSAVPALIKIVDRNISRASLCSTIMALGDIGPPAREAVPSLLRCAANSDWEVRFHAIVALREVHAEPNRVFSMLTNALHDPDLTVRGVAAVSLGKLGPDARPTVPALVEFINAPQNRADRQSAVDALKQIDPKAAAAILSGTANLR